MTDWFVPPHVTQRTGSPCQFSLCWAAVGAWLASAATDGSVTLTPEEFARKAGGGSGRPNESTGCKTGFEVDLRKGLSNLGIESALFTVPFADLADRLTPDRRAVFAVAVDYSAWPRDKDCMNGMAGPDVDHMVGIIPGTDAQGRVKVMNPLCEDYQRVALADVSGASRKFARERSRDGIIVVRVMRQMPRGLPEDKARIAELKAENENLRDRISAMTVHAREIVVLGETTGEDQ